MQRNITSGYGGDAAMQGLLDRICVASAPLSESFHMRKVGPHYAKPCGTSVPSMHA